MARAIADAMAPPMLELAICCINMINGKTSEIPARAFDPIRPTKWASTVAVTAMRTTLTMTLGAARRSNVLTIGPSSRSRVRAAAGFAAGVTDAVWAIEKLVVVIAHSCPRWGLEQRLDESVLGKPGGCGKGPIGDNYAIVGRLRKPSFLGLA